MNTSQANAVKESPN